MPSSPAVNAGASSRALQPQAQDNQQTPPSSIQQGSLAGRSVIRQEATGESCPQMPKHNAPTVSLPKFIWSYAAQPTRRTVYQLQATDVIKAQQVRFVRALVTCLQENVSSAVCRESIKEMCRPVSRVTPANISWKIEDLIETAKEVYPRLKLESISDVKEGARALVKAISETYGNHPLAMAFSWKEIIDAAHTATVPTEKITFRVAGSDTFEEKCPLWDNEILASTKMLDNIAAAHTLYNIAVKEFGQEVAECIDPFLDGQADLNFKEIWRLDVKIKELLFKESNPEKYAESYAKHSVKTIEESLGDGVPISKCIKNLEEDFLIIKSILYPGQQAQDAEADKDFYTWFKIITYISTMPRMTHLKGDMGLSAESIVKAIARNNVTIPMKNLPEEAPIDAGIE